MACLAFLPAFTIVDILQPVTGNTSSWQILVHFRGMAQCTANLFVGINKRKFRFPVIERFSVTPGLRFMTGLTFLTELAFVWLILLVARYACTWRIPELDCRFMTGVTGRWFMRASQRKISELMIEGFRIEQDRISIPANMIRVAMPAFGLNNVLSQTVKASGLFYIAIDLFMTVKTQT